MKHVDPYLKQGTGNFIPPPESSSILASETYVSGCSEVAAAPEKSSTLNCTSQARQCNKRKSLTPPSLTPASKIARREQSIEIECPASNEEEMDKRIQEHFLGMYGVYVGACMQACVH